MRAPTCPAPRGARAATATASGSCVEIAVLSRAIGEHYIAIRDSKDPHGPALAFSSPPLA